MKRVSANRPLARLMGCTALAGLVCTPLAAQESATGSPVYLGELRFTVLGADPVGGQMDPFTLTGVLTPTRLTEIPQSVSILSSEGIARTNAGKIDEALSYTPGVQAAPYAYDTDTNWIFLRGYDATQTGVFMDGAQLYSYGFGSFYIDPFLVERVEVLRGPASMVYGSSNPGGLVNYVTRLPTGERAGLVEVGTNEQGRSWVSLDWGDAVNERVAYRFGAKFQQTDGYGMFEPGQTGVLSGAVSTAFDNGGVLTFSANYTTMDETHVGGHWLPYYGAVQDVGFGTFDRYFNSGEPGYDDYQREQVIATAIYRQELENGLTLTDTFRYGVADVQESQVYAYGYSGFALTPQDPNNLLSRIFFEHDSRATVLSNDLNVLGQFDTGAVSHDLLLGLDARLYRLDQVQGSVAWPGAATLLSASDPVYGAAQPATTPYLDQELEQTQIGLYAQDQMRWGAGWLATVNARYDWVNTTSTVDAATGVDGVDRSDSEFSWRFGLSRELGDFTPYVTFGTYFNPQIVANPAGDEIVPESGQQAEIGVKWSPDQDNLFTLAAFDIRRENISLDQYDFETGAYYYYQIGEVRSRGIELEYRGRLTEELSMTTGVTWLDVEILNDLDDSIVGMTPYSVAERQGSLSLIWEPAAIEGLTLTGGLRYTGGSWADNQNTLRVPDRTLYDIGAQYAFDEGWTANLFVSNVADTSYVSSCQTAYWCYQGEGRNISLSVSHSF